MSAIDFPNSPSVNQTYTVGNRSWIWTGSVWESVAIPGPTGPTGPDGTYQVAPTPPASPDEGDIWYDELTGASYLYYDNFWVEIGGPQGPTGPQGIVGPQGAGLTILGQYNTL